MVLLERSTSAFDFVIPLDVYLDQPHKMAGGGGGNGLLIGQIVHMQ